MNDYLVRFRQAIEASGLEAPSEIIADGKLHRFNSDGKRGAKNGWYVMYDDALPAGAFGCWRRGIKSTWCAKPDHEQTVNERTAVLDRLHSMQRLREADGEKLNAEARSIAASKLAQSKVVTEHSYLTNKGIGSNNVKVLDGNLLIPICDTEGTLHSLQTVSSDGTKRFLFGGRLKGCYFSIGRVDGRIVVCEGFATGASIYECTGHAVSVAFSAGNLESVARALREKYPELIIIIAADDDYLSADNSGLTKARAAALAVDGLMAVPVFHGERPEKATDFNDLHQFVGAESVKLAIAKACPPPREVQCAPPLDTLAGRAFAMSHVRDLQLARMVNIRCGSSIVPLPITWLWDFWIPAGKLTILAGTAGTGKTTLALGLAAALTSGGCWPDGKPCIQRGNVLIWSSEDNPDDTLVPRLIAVGADLARCHFIDGITQNNEKVPFDPAKDIPELNKAVEKIGGVSLLLIDPIVSAVAGDMHRANDVRRSLQPLVDFAERHGCAVIGITHFAKGGEGKAPADRVIGSQAFGALARMVLVAAKEEGGLRRVLARAKSNIAPDDGGVAYSISLSTIAGGIDAAHVVWEGAIEGTAREILGEVEHVDNSDGSSSNELEKMLVDLLTEHGGEMSASLVQEAVSAARYSWAAANRAKSRAGIKSVKESGSKTGAWTWHLPNIMDARIQRE